MSKWYLLRSGQSYGPYPEETIRDWVRGGQIAANESLARVGNPTWLSLDKIPEFEADFWASPEAPSRAPQAGAYPAAPVQIQPQPVQQPPVQYQQPQYPAAQYPQPPGYYYPQPGPQAYGLKNKTTAGLLALFLGGTGAHHFYLGNVGLAVGYLVTWLSGVALSSIFIGWLWVWIPGLLAFIEAIIYLTTSEDRFQRNYHNWFCSGP